MHVTDHPIEPPNSNTMRIAQPSSTSVPPRMAPLAAASSRGPGTIDHETGQKYTVIGEQGFSEAHLYNAVSPEYGTSDHDATPRGEYPPHHISTSTTLATPSPRKALQRYKTVKPPQSTGTLPTSVLGQARNKDQSEIPNSKDGDSSVRNREHGSEGKGISSGSMTSRTSKGKEPRNVDCIAPSDVEAADSQGGFLASIMKQSTSKDGGTTETRNITQPREDISDRQETIGQAPHPSVTSNGSASSGSTEHGEETQTTTTSPSSRPWLLSRSSSSTIDIPIESTEPSSPQEAESAVEAAASMVVPSDSYFPDVTTLLQGAGVLETTQESTSSRSGDMAVQTESPRNTGTKNTPSSAVSSPPNDRKPKSTAWPCSKKHGDTPIGMSVALALTDALGFKLGNPNAQLKTGTPSKVAPAKVLGEDAGSWMMDASGNHGGLSPTSQPHPSTEQKHDDDLRRQMSDAQASTLATDRFLSSSVPVGKQASLSQHSGARSMEDSLLESWGFTVSTPLCPPKCYPLSSPALNSVSKDRFCRASSSSSLSSTEKDDSRRRVSSSTPPASSIAPPHASAYGNILGSRKSYTFSPGDDNSMQKQQNAPPPRSRLGSITAQPRTSSPMRDVVSDSPPSGRPSLLRDTSNDSISGHSEAVSSSSNTPASSRHNSATGSDFYNHSRPWRRDSTMSAQSFDTSGTSRSSGVFSIDLVDHPGRHDDGSGFPAEGHDGAPNTHPSDAFYLSAVGQPAGEASPDDTSHSDEPHVVPYEGIVNIIPYDDKYLVSVIMEGFTLDNITVAVKSVRNGIDKTVADDNCSIKSCGSANSGKSITAGNKTRKTKCVHLVADRWDDGVHFERKIAFGTDADFSKGIKARFDGNELQIDSEFLIFAGLFNRIN